MYYEYPQRNGHGFRIEKLQRKDGNLTDERDARYLAIRLTREMGFCQCTGYFDVFSPTLAFTASNEFHRQRQVDECILQQRRYVSFQKLLSSEVNNR